MFCEKCGHQLEDGSIFCENCGAKVQQSEEVPQKETMQQEPAPAVESQARCVPSQTPQVSRTKKKGSGGKIALIVISAVLVLAILGIGTFFLVRHFNGGNSHQVPERILAQVREDARPEEYRGSYRGEVCFDVSLHAPLEDLGLLSSKIRNFQSMSGKKYGVSAELKNDELIVFCPEAPAADADGKLFSVPVKKEQAEKGVIRNVEKEAFGSKEITSGTDIYLTKDGGLYVSAGDTVEEDGKVLVSVKSEMELERVAPAAVEKPEETPSDLPDAPQDRPEQIPEDSSEVQEEPTARYQSIPEEHILFRNWSTAAVQSGPPNDIKITLNQDVYVEAIMNWHWFTADSDEYRTATIALENADTGKVFGPWPVECDSADSGQNLGAWIVFPETKIPSGNYILKDSNTESWSYVPRETRDCGMTEIKGTLASEAPEKNISGTYKAAYIGKSGEEIPPIHQLVPYDPEIPMVINEDGSGKVVFGDEWVTFTRKGDLIHTVDASGHEEDISFRVEDNAIILTNSDGSVLIFVK